MADWVVLLSVLVLSACTPSAAWDADMELLDLVEEIPETFYQFLSVEQDAPAAEIKKAYRRLSLILHPDKNKDANAESQFRQLVAIYEVLKDEERRNRYDDILLNGLPDWRQPVFYYRRVRKMSNSELAFLLFLILTVGHYVVLWSIYLEKQLDEVLSKKKKEKKKKINSKLAEEVKWTAPDRPDRAQERPHWQDILPLKVSMWIYLSIKHAPQTLQEVQQFYKDYQQMKQHQREEEEAQQEVVTREKRPKVKKAKMDFPVYVPSEDELNFQSYQQAASIEEVEDQLDEWLQDQRHAKKKASEWSEDDISLLSRLMGKFPGGTPGRWEKIALELGRSVTDVTTKVKQAKDNVNLSTGLVKLSELKKPSIPARSLPVPDCVMTQRVGVASGEPQEELIPAAKKRNKKNLVVTNEGELRVRARRQKDFHPEEEDEEGEPQENKPDLMVWTQNQQKLLELALQQFPRGTAERWDCIAKVVPGKSKEDCIVRYKILAELVQKRKQAKS
ncbi:dnaJ homolog subfamily C member 1 [Entelurus aequoreus]|uniref:dnaJ homolog subfamily C member 1 n=1 Tax=Entelurus aequoreus TaxID=161455 RepID=UPI002B1E6DB2|nr:dnaJ homolog subfamily C member 1 [Entelurus aequoreus]